MALDDERARPQLPLSRGGLDSGEELGRILALSDGVFAFAMTLLVLNLAIPSTDTLLAAAPGQSTNAQLGQYLWGERIVFFAYGLAFFIIGTWWIVHHRIFRFVARYDRRLMTINLGFLLFIAITPFDVGILANYSNTSIGVSFYAATQTFAGLGLVTLLIYLRGPGRHLMDRRTTNAMLHRGLLLSGITPIGFALSIPLAFVAPFAAVVSWIAIFVARALIVRSFPDPAGDAPLAPSPGTSRSPESADVRDPG